MAIYLGNKLQSGGTSAYDLAVAQGYQGTQEEFWALMYNIGTLANRVDELENTLGFFENDDFMEAIFA